MNSAVAGVLGGGVVAAYVPLLRRQIRAGSIQVGHVGVKPILVTRHDHPLAFRIVAAAVPAAVALLLAACALLVAEAFA